MFDSKLELMNQRAARRARMLTAIAQVEQWVASGDLHKRRRQRLARAMSEPIRTKGAN